MKYIVLSCEQYLKTRARWQRDTWLPTIPSFVFLTGAIQTTEPNVFPTSAHDGYDSCPTRYFQYIREHDLSDDWVIFADDDTFMFPCRLESYLKTLNPDRRFYIGRELNGGYMSGGAGFVLSRAAYAALRGYLLNTPKEKVMFDRHGDVTMGLWMKELKDLNRINSNLFNCCTHTHSESSNLDTAFSYHYVTEDLFTFYGELLKKGDSVVPDARDDVQERVPL